jgi:hypothetical protein
MNMIESDTADGMRFRRTYRAVGAALAVVFAAVGFVFLLAPETVLVFFNSFSSSFGLPPAPIDGGGLYSALAVGYMYVVTLLAALMFHRPANPGWIVLLVNAKAASAVASLLLFFLREPYLVLLTNGVVDGGIAAGLLFLRFAARETRK